MDDKYIDQLIILLHEKLKYNPDTGGLTWIDKGKGHEVGELAGSIHYSGYRRIYFNRRTWQDSQLAYLYMTGEYSRYIGRADNDYGNCKFENLFPSIKRITASHKPPEVSKKMIMECLDGKLPLKVFDLALVLNTREQNIRKPLNELFKSGFVARHSGAYSISASGHQEIFVGGEFNNPYIQEQAFSLLLFQTVMPGTLTACTNAIERARVIRDKRFA